MNHILLRSKHEVDPDEIFIDSKNLPSFDTDRFEGRIEQALSKHAVRFFSIVCILAGCFYLGRIFYLQGYRGESFALRSQDNSLQQVPLYAERGTISDRNDVLLAWNESDGTRVYKPIEGISNTVGHLGLPTPEEVITDASINPNHLIGKDGVEQSYNKTLEGVAGVRLEEHDAHNVPISESIQIFPRKGTNLKMTIDVEVQEKLYKLIRATAEEKGFTGGAGGIMNVRTGELLALVTYPEYKITLFASSTPSALRAATLNNPRTPFLNRATSGLYAPGSIVKPFMAIAALAEQVITPEKKILSTGSISIPNPYDKTKETLFKDWQAQGWVNMRQALAVSSDVYFYEVGGGYKDQPGIGINAINRYMRLFGLGGKTGVDLWGEEDGNIPSPAWKEKYFNGEQWYIGDTYHTAIGQYGFQVTPLQMIRAISAIATRGTLVRPHIAFSPDATETIKVNTSVTLDFPEEYYTVVQEGMRESVRTGTATGLAIPGFPIAGKTGTAELGFTKQSVNSWVEGFFPYNNPRYAFALVMEKGPLHNPVGATYVMRQFIDWLIETKPEYTKPLVGNTRI